jgi:methyl-accepting chemotaxis protein
MPKSGARHLLGKGKGYLSDAGAQYRFIIFLIIVLGVYTFLLKVFQKLAEIVQLPVFLPVALITLLFFIGIVGSLYSHRFVGPMVRIRKALDHLAEGDANISLRLRESDDPTLKELVNAITRLCEYSRNSHALIQETAKDMFEEIELLRERINQGADPVEIQKTIEDLLRKKDLLDKAVKFCDKK